MKPDRAPLFTFYFWLWSSITCFSVSLCLGIPFLPNASKGYFPELLLRPSRGLRTPLPPVDIDSVRVGTPKIAGVPESLQFWLQRTKISPPQEIYAVTSGCARKKSENDIVSRQQKWHKLRDLVNKYHTTITDEMESVRGSKSAGQYRVLHYGKENRHTSP